MSCGFLLETHCSGDPDDRLAHRAGHGLGTNDSARHPYRPTRFALPRDARGQHLCHLSHHVDRLEHLGHVVSSHREQ
jgi:hypothetical protein